MPRTRSNCDRRHSPGEVRIDVAGVKRARCRVCGLNLRRGVGTLTWIIADMIGAPIGRSWAETDPKLTAAGLSRDVSRDVDRVNRDLPAGH